MGTAVKTQRRVTTYVFKITSQAKYVPTCQDNPSAMKFVAAYHS